VILDEKDFLLDFVWVKDFSLKRNTFSLLRDMVHPSRFDTKKHIFIRTPFQIFKNLKGLVKIVNTGNDDRREKLLRIPPTTATASKIPE
jgi:hypothetical protein